MGKEYLDKLKHPKWQQKRLRILDRDKFTCTLCEDTETTLHIHHTSYTGNPWDAPDEELETLCEHCHALKEYYKKNYPYPMSILNISKRESLGSFIILYVYRTTDNKKVIDIFSLSRIDDQPNLTLETIFSERDTDTFIDFVKSISH